MSGVLAVLAGTSGTGPVLDTQTVTRGTFSSGSNPSLQYSGYAQSITGSISDGTSNLYSGASILGIYFYQEAYTSPPVGYTTRRVILSIAGVCANSGWTTMKVGSTNFMRASAAYSVSTNTNWIWDIPINDPFTSEGDPFSATTTVEWT